MEPLDFCYPRASIPSTVAIVWSCSTVSGELSTESSGKEPISASLRSMSLIFFDIRPRHHVFLSVSPTRDLNTVRITLDVVFHPDTSRLPWILQNLGLKTDEEVLPSIAKDVLIHVVSQFNADQLLVERPKVSALVRESLIQRAKDFSIILDDVAITGLSLDLEISRVLKQKQTLQEEVMKLKAEQRGSTSEE